MRSINEEKTKTDNSIRWHPDFGIYEFICIGCNRLSTKKSYPRTKLCRDCATKKAALKRRQANIDVALTDSLVVTKEIENRFRKKSEQEISQTALEKFGDNLSRWGHLFFWITAYPISNALFPVAPEFTGMFWIVFCAWALGGGFLFMYIGDLIASNPKKERNSEINARIIELAEERKNRIDEAKQFYSSPEWIKMRRQVIEEDGRICARCGNEIISDDDVTVDHKKPRSKYPALSLKRDNLRVLCRSCNSSKGANDWIEV